VLISVLINAGNSAAQATDSSDSKTKALSGSLDAGLDFQWSDRDSDYNLDQSLRLNLDPQQHKRIHFQTNIWMHEDLDGDEGAGSALGGLDDTYSNNYRARILSLHVDIDDLWGDSKLRIGRQRILEGVAYNRIDGAYFSQTRAPWRWYAFGGLRASMYDNDHHDLVLGGGASFRPGPRTRLSLDYFYGEENRSSGDIVYRSPYLGYLGLLFPRRVKQNLNETAVALSAWHDMSENIRLYGRYLWKDGNGDEIQAALTGFVPGPELAYELTVRSQLTAAGDQVNDLSNFYRIVGVFEPYYNVLAAIHYPINERSLVSLEVEIHDSENDNPFSANRDFERYAIIWSGEEVAKDTDATVALERWAVSGGEGTWAITGELTRSWEDWSLTFGADFERYEDRFVRYNPWPSIISGLRVALDPNVFVGFTPIADQFDTTVVTTHENVYSVYARGRWSFKNGQRLWTRVTYEEDDGPDAPYWRVEAEYSIDF
jgi:hypothetical protein